MVKVGKKINVKSIVLFSVHFKFGINFLKGKKVKRKDIAAARHLWIPSKKGRYVGNQLVKIMKSEMNDLFIIGFCFFLNERRIINKIMKIQRGI